MTSMLDRVLGKKLNPVTTIWWVPTAYISNPLAPTLNEIQAGSVKVYAKGGLIGDTADPIRTSEKYEGKLTFFRDSSDTTPFETVFNLFKEPEVTTPAKPDYARMERKELMDRIDLLENALGSTETNVRTYMKDAKELGALLAEERRKRVPLTTHAHAAEIRSLEAQRDAAQVRRNELQDELHNQRTKYKIKLKECGAVIGTLKGMIKELNRELGKQ